MSKLEKVSRLAGAGGILTALVMLPVLLAGTARAAGPPTDAFYVNYFANAQLGTTLRDDVIRVVDDSVRPSGNPSTPSAPIPLCAMVYVFDEFQEMQECCGCPVSPGGRLDLSVDGLTFFPTDDWVTTGGSINGSSLLYRGTIKIVSTYSTIISVSSNPGNNGPCAGLTQVYCDATGEFYYPSPLPGLRAWSTHLLNPTSGQVAETRFQKTGEPDSDLEVLESECADINSVTNYSPASTSAARGNCAAVCAAPGVNPYPGGHYGATQDAFFENEPGEEYPGGLCYTGQ